MSKKRVLIAEDDPIFFKILETELPKEEYDVEVVRNGAQAIASIRNHKPDLLLLDLIMPVKSGFQVLEEIRNDPKLQDLKIVVTSNLGDETNIKRAKGLGVLEYLVKSSISFEELTEKIKGYLEEE